MVQNDTNQQKANPSLEKNNQKIFNNVANDVWFFIPSEQWFLNKTLQDAIEGFESWFKEPIKSGRRRVEKKKRPDVNNVTIQIADTADLLQQYYNLREGAFRLRSGYETYDGQENEFDKKGKIAVAINNDNEVVAGARIGFSGTGYLSNEDPEENFTYQEICKKSDIDVETSKYVEISGVVTVENKSHLLGKIFIFIASYCRNLGISYVLGVGNPECNGNYCSTLAKINIRAFSVEKIPAPLKPQYNNTLMHPMIAIL